MKLVLFFPYLNSENGTKIIKLGQQVFYLLRLAQYLIYFCFLFILFLCFTLIVNIEISLNIWRLSKISTNIESLGHRIKKKFTNKNVNMSENFPQKDTTSTLKITIVVSESYFSDLIVLKNIEWRRNREWSQRNHSIERQK